MKYIAVNVWDLINYTNRVACSIYNIYKEKLNKTYEVKFADGIVKEKVLSIDGYCNTSTNSKYGTFSITIDVTEVVKKASPKLNLPGTPKKATLKLIFKKAGWQLTSGEIVYMYDIDLEGRDYPFKDRTTIQAVRGWLSNGYHQEGNTITGNGYEYSRVGKHDNLYYRAKIPCILTIELTSSSKTTYNKNKQKETIINNDQEETIINNDTEENEDKPLFSLKDILKNLQGMVPYAIGGILLLAALLLARKK